MNSLPNSNRSFRLSGVAKSQKSIGHGPTAIEV
uniref:Uncharacterized protein n=1 Tax=Arundo donax TaxID=35708 RepID=A0A0A8YJK4_ARUDO